MPLKLSKEEIDEAIPSIQTYMREEFDQEISDLKARLLLEYFMQEIAPLAYNRGVADADSFLRKRLEDLPATCHEFGMTFWTNGKR